MIRDFFTTLQALPAIPRTDGPRLATESLRAFHSLLDFLRGEITMAHHTLNAAMTLMWHRIGNNTIPVLLDPAGGSLPSLHFFFFFEPRARKDIVFYALPYGFLASVRADPLMQCCALVNMASQGCDYVSHRLDWNESPKRAQAYEAELLLLLRPLMHAEGLPWELNAYLQSVQRAYPSGLDSLPEDQRYAPPASPLS